jgi:hypothetical protein
MLPAEWTKIAERAGYPLTASDSATVTLDGGGTQVVKFRLDEGQNILQATSVIASRSVLAAASDGLGDHYAWERNRLSDLIGFRVDSHHGRLIGEAWIPLDGLTPGEFALYVTELARVCDWHEFRLSGTDVY